MIKKNRIEFDVLFNNDPDLDVFLDRLDSILKSCERLLELGVPVKIVSDIMQSIKPQFDEDS